MRRRARRKWKGPRPQRDSSTTRRRVPTESGRKKKRRLCAQNDERWGTAEVVRRMNCKFGGDLKFEISEAEKTRGAAEGLFAGVDGELLLGPG
jgi:hypothetical protein